MQYKKEEIKNKILEKAEIEFYSNGYEKASIRKIVKAAGTTIGNFYNYFENKEALFDELVKATYNDLQHIIQNHNNEEEASVWNLTDIIQWRELLYNILKEIIPKFTRKFILLIECSEGTQYAKTRTKLIQLIGEHFNEHIKIYNSNYPYDDMGLIFGEQLLNGIIMILKKYDNDEDKNKLLTEYILFYVIGTLGLISDFK